MIKIQYSKQPVWLFLIIPSRIRKNWNYRKLKRLQNSLKIESNSYKEEILITCREWNLQNDMLYFVQNLASMFRHISHTKFKIILTTYKQKTT